MLETSYFPNSSHFEIYTVATLRPFRCWLSFLASFSSAVVWGVNLAARVSETWGRVKAASSHQSGWKPVPSSSTVALNFTACCHLLEVKGGAVPIQDHDSRTSSLCHLAAFPTRATLYTFCSHSNSSSKKCEGNPGFHVDAVEANWI